MKKRSMLKLEQKYLRQGYDFVIGVDEAGRGPLAGPVVAVAVSPRNLKMVIGNLDKESPDYELLFTNYSKIKDSKKLSEKQREYLYDFICEHFHIGIGICDHKTIDRINILEASFLAMKKALAELARNLKFVNSNLDKKKTRDDPNYNLLFTNYIVLVDGNKIIPNCSYKQKAIVGGDNLVKSISAASIIAKVTRDRMMKKMHKKYPEYNFAKHKGYGTKLHMEMIVKHGPCEIHRKSFSPFTNIPI